MPSFATITAALALTATVVAGPVERRKAFSIEQVHKKTFAKNGAAATVKTLRKFGKAVPENLLKAAEIGPNNILAVQASSGSDPATPGDAYDSSYLCPVTIGTTNPTTVNLDFDTGSGDLWVFSSLQSSSQLSGHDYYKVDSSKKISGATWKISYGDGSGAAGTVYADKVVVGGVTATSQAVEAATSVSSAFSSDQDTDGLLGLSFSTLNTVRPTPQTTFFDSVKSSLASPLFAADLKYHTAGSYDFGYIDTSKYTGAITYTDVDTSQGWWQFSFSGYSVGTGSTVSSSINGIADTGTTLLYLPTAVVKAYYAKVSGATNSATYGGYVFSCSATLPDFTLVLNGVKQRVPGKYINYSPVQTGSSTCFGGIQTNDGIGFSIFGDIFLKSKYVIFDGSATPRIGFADQPSL
ncbi:Aspartic protease snp2 [Paraphaeosphaeria sporulosa]|uniref:Asp-domain-containing protein n=1 Tax=Paraphaeosphaeria sporulosa TaxID=1460663 RepID=A0A177C8X2_9PLEO|nr:Asp-domain-containing protein [Paraphaeosphaeria sporulosa]OAG04093.1 Asp-domain-containing protein [Paraphaeosphaeria sporulosa]